MNRKLTAASAVALVVFALAGWTMDVFNFDRASRIRVTGTSTLHNWECGVNAFTGTFAGQGDAAALAGINTLTVTVPVAQLNCNNNGTMNGKMREALGTSNISFTMSNATVARPAGGRFAVTTNGTLSIHGQTRPVQITAQGQVLADGRYRFTGTVPVTMSQFGVRPPTAMMGTVRTGDRVTVHFDVTVAR